jgi:4-hydroxy-tetrahydrodipicolinate synthase
MYFSFYSAFIYDELDTKIRREGEEDMAKYTKREAREWAKENLRGMANVIIPTFTQDLTRLNEKGIRHDVRKVMEFGFTGTLLVSETATTFDEYNQFVTWAVDEAKGRLHLIHHASFNTLEENIRAVQASEAAGADLVLLSYPPNFYPKNQNEIFEYTKAFCDATNLGIILFPVPLWGFERLHPAGMDPKIIDRMIKEIPNIVAIKAEAGMPLISGFAHMYNLYKDDVVVSMPLEDNALPLATLVPMKWMGTSNYEYFGPTLPKLFNLIQEGRTEEAFDLYWKIHPARLAHAAQSATTSGANFLHRMAWKYQGWLTGMNGGPLRAPTMRLNQKQMSALRQGLIQSGIEVTSDDDSQFFIGRNPE